MKQYEQCPICANQQLSSKMLSITTCRHKFCLNCCVEHIKVRSHNFSEIRCPEYNCSGVILSEHQLPPQIINSLPAKTIQQIKSYNQYKQFQGNSKIRPCSIPDCSGVINMLQNRKQCSICGTPHCPKCMKAFHNGNCVLDQHDQNMRIAGYQKCPNCSIWVQKWTGCRYIDCKCGTAFCYNCGIRFEEDPCRLEGAWKNQKKLVYRVILFLSLTVFGSLLLILSILIGQVALIILSPFIIVCLAFANQGTSRTLTLIFMPFLSVCLAVFFLLALLLYPFARKRYHHGIYDGIDSYLGSISLVYLRAVTKIITY